MRPEDNEDSIDPHKLTGMILVGIGAMTLLLITISVVQIIRNPSKSDLVQWLDKTLEGQHAVLSGNFDGSTFEIQASEAFQYIFLCLVGLIILRLMTSIFMAFIKSGTALMAQANEKKKEQETRQAAKPPKLRYPPAE